MKVNSYMSNFSYTGRSFIQPPTCPHARGVSVSSRLNHINILCLRPWVMLACLDMAYTFLLRHPRSWVVLRVGMDNSHFFGLESSFKHCARVHIVEVHLLLMRHRQWVILVWSWTACSVWLWRPCLWVKLLSSWTVHTVGLGVVIALLGNFGKFPWALRTQRVLEVKYPWLWHFLDIFS